MLEKVAVIDKKIAKKVFNNQAMGQSIYINGEGFKVVGVSESSEVDESGMPIAVSYTHLTLPTTLHECRSRWSPYH